MRNQCGVHVAWSGSFSLTSNIVGALVAGYKVSKEDNSNSADLLYLWEIVVPEYDYKRKHSQQNLLRNSPHLSPSHTGSRR